MLVKFAKLAKFPELICGISTREFGDCRKNPEKFLKTLGLRKENLVLMEQVHGNKIKAVGDDDRGKTVTGVDGLITSTAGVILGVKTADCLPILFSDPVAKNIGVCHAGWRGILVRIAQKMVDLLIKNGSSPLDILVAVGPHICSKCYTVGKDRADRFLAEFGQGKIHLDLLAPVKTQLVHSGILPKNVFIADVCTACQNKEFFSYYQNGPETGRMLSVISLK